MKGLIITEPGKTACIDLPDPKPALGEVLLKICRVGFCGSDLSTFRGVNPLVSYPRVPGHEIAATIISKGDKVPDKFSVGKQVLVVPYTECGVCSSCRQGRLNCCRNNQTLGVQRDGGLSEFLVLPWQKLMISSQLSLAELALVEPLTVGFHAAWRARIKRGEKVAVFGCGMIGLGAIAGAANLGARVIAIDVDDNKLSIAKALGASEMINSSSSALHGSLQELSGGEGPSVIIEAVGLPVTYRAAVEEVAFGGRVVCIGYAKEPVAFETKQFVLKELDILGSRNARLEDFKTVVKYLEKGSMPLDRIITQTVSLSEAGEALAYWNSNPAEITKIQVAVS